MMAGQCRNRQGFDRAGGKKWDDGGVLTGILVAARKHVCEGSTDWARKVFIGVGVARELVGKFFLFDFSFGGGWRGSRGDADPAAMGTPSSSHGNVVYVYSSNVSS